MNSDTLIIVIIGACLGLLVFVAGLSKAYRSLSATSNPLPPVQPLAHHRRSYYQLHVHSGSKSSLLDEEYLLVDPQPPFHSRPSSEYSSRTPRPASVASSSRLSPSPSLAPSGRRGLPHSPHSQMHVVLPAPLSSPPSDEFGQLATPRRPLSYTRPSSRHFLATSEHDRRSMSIVDRWLPSPPSLPIDPPIPQRRAPSPLIPLSISSSTLSNPSPNPSDINITLDPAIVTPDSIPNPDQNPMPISIPSAVTADIPPIPLDNIPIPVPSSLDSNTGDNVENTDTIDIVVDLSPSTPLEV